VTWDRRSVYVVCLSQGQTTESKGLGRLTDLGEPALGERSLTVAAL